jgi:hypothetical protein
MFKKIVTEFNETYTGYHANKKHYFKKKYPEIYSSIIAKYATLSEKSPYPELSHCVINDIHDFPVCKFCSKSIEKWNYQRNAYSSYCSKSCSSKASIQVCHQKSDIEHMKHSRKKTLIKRYGVSNPSHIESVRNKLSNAKTRYWKDVYGKKDFTTCGMSKEEYRRRNQQYTNTQYNRHKNIIDPENKRGVEWHLDHIYSVSDGFVNNVPINILSDVSNLRLIHSSENYKKNRQSYKKLYEDYLSHHTNHSSS